MSEIRPGDRLGAFEVRSLLGEGGPGSTLIALDRWNTFTLDLCAAEALEACGLRYLVGGSLASSVSVRAQLAAPPARRHRTRG